MKPLKITAGLLMLLQVFHLACLQTSTDSPGRTIDKSWLRMLSQNEVQAENAATSGESAFDQATESSNDFNSGITSGFMAEEEENMTTQDRSANETFDESSDFSTPMPSTFENETAEETKLPEVAISPRNISTESTNSSQTNTTDAAVTSSSQEDNTTSVGEDSNNTDIQSTTTTAQPTTTTKPEEDTEKTSTSAATTVEPEVYSTTTKLLTTTAPQPETTPTSPLTTIAGDSITPDLANKTGKIGIGSDRGSVGEPGSAVDTYRSKRNVAWLAVLGTAAVAAIVGLVAYVVLKKKHQKAFAHRRLEEMYPSDPVLRLDNLEPLDLNFGGSAYYNPALQDDSIHMRNIPGRR